MADTDHDRVEGEGHHEIYLAGGPNLAPYLAIKIRAFGNSPAMRRLQLALESARYVAPTWPAADFRMKANAPTQPQSPHHLHYTGLPDGAIRVTCCSPLCKDFARTFEANHDTADWVSLERMHSGRTAAEIASDAH